MKLRKLLFAASPIVLLATSAMLPITSCSKNLTPVINSVEVRCAPINMIKYMAKIIPTGYISSGLSTDVYHFNGSEIGYISVDDYVKTMMSFNDLFGESSGFTNYTSSTQNGITTIKNGFTKATCTIDYSKQTLTFSDYDAFLCYEESSASPLTVGCGGGEKYFYSVSSKYISGGKYVINLANYNIKAYLYEGSGFIPYDLFRNLLNPMPLAYLFYNGVQFYEIFDWNAPITMDLYKPAVKEATVLIPEYMEFTYNLLALTLDHRFGLKYRPSRVNPGKTIDFFPNGAYAALRPYHDKIVSLDKNVSNNALAEFFAANADDGGHAGYNGTNLLTTEQYEEGANIGPEKANTFATEASIVKARTAAKNDFQSYWTDPVRGKQDQEWYDTNKPDCYYEEMLVDKTGGGQETVAYITFDAFNEVDMSKVDTDWDDAERQAGRELGTGGTETGHTNASNYWKDTMRLTMYAADKIDINNKIKKVVIDISNNGGGTVYTEHFIASWLCGGVTEKIYNPHTNAYCEYTVRADIDGDGEFTEGADYLRSDVQVYVITTAKSFSCGNMLPCNLADNRPSTYFIGQSSGGGACFVDGNMHIGLGNVFRSSSNYHMLRNASSYNNYISVEAGCPNDYFINPFVNPEKLYDRDAINQKIVNG